MNQCIRLSQSLMMFSNSRPVKEVKLSLIGVQSILGNLRSVNKLSIDVLWDHIFILIVKLVNEWSY
jgi:hypothetical protein